MGSTTNRCSFLMCIYICVFFFCSLPLERDPFASILIDRINSSTRLPLILVKRLSFQRPLHENNHFGGGGGGEDRIRAHVTFDKGAGVIIREIEGSRAGPRPSRRSSKRGKSVAIGSRTLRDGIERPFPSIHGELSSPPPNEIFFLIVTRVFFYTLR